MTPLSLSHSPGSAPRQIGRLRRAGRKPTGRGSFNINAATIGRLAPLRQGRFSMDYQEISCTRKDGGKFRDWWHVTLR